MNTKEKNSIAVVILNYLNYEDTIACVGSIRQHDYKLSGIVIVDNGSSNGSFQQLHEEFADVPNIVILGLDKNLGFSKGNNIGIKYALSNLNADFVFCCNNDVLFLEDDYFDKLLDKYDDDVAVIGSAIVNDKDEIQEQNRLNFSPKNILNLYLITYADINGTSFSLPFSNENRECFLHGSALLFTPEFFRFYKGFYKRTFLYCEEPILYLMCKEKGLKQVYVPEAKIKHLEDKSSELSFNNDLSVMSKYSFDSMKWLVYWAFRDYVRGLFRKQREDN